MRSESKHLHYYAIFSDFISDLRDLILPVGIGAFIGFRHFFSSFGYMMIVPLIILVWSFFRWLRFKYEITNEHFHLQSGVLVRRDRYIRISRIQSIQVQTNILLRPFNLVQLKLDTADPADKGNVVLGALKKNEAEHIKKLLHHGVVIPDGASDHQSTQSGKIYRLSAGRLLIAGLISSNLGVIIGAVIAVQSQVGDLIPSRLFGYSMLYIERLSLIFIVLMIVFVLILVWLISLAVTCFRWWGFTLTATGEEWRIHKGIIQTTDETYKLDRVQAVRIKEHMLQQLLGYCTVYAECSGSISDEKQHGGSVLVFPIIRKKELPAFLESLIPKFSGPIALKRNPVRGLGYAAAKPLSFTAVVCGGLSWFFPWGHYAWLSLPLFAAFFFFTFRSTGFFLDGSRIVFSNRTFAKTTLITLKKHIQLFEKEMSPVQRRIGLGSCRFSIRSSLPQFYEVNQIKKSDADKLFQWFRE